MLPPAARLRRRAEFAATTRGGRRAGRGSLVVHLAPPDGDATVPRVGFAVSRAVGNAVVRNTVRRRLRHLVRDRLDTLPDGSTLVVRALPAAAERTFQELARDLDAALTAAREPRRGGPRQPGRTGMKARRSGGAS
ncbi:ribonuclease P protein component [Actinocatenispora rupis]|uniref:Ribonuclease P protein component n=1 Tax=Actinocatenispora rupis TaxID=519421 RepID=A0A8J3JAX6_9ACTN|nr:ribonuclease P protein component [Actinocatenispora rupis]GID13242.1 ribonuclease P protein component [Actinocatenispora rupis]